MVVGKIDLRVGYTLGAFAAMSGVYIRERKLDTRVMYLSRGLSRASYLERYRMY